jgi:hypothetical protein
VLIVMWLERKSCQLPLFRSKWSLQHLIPKHKQTKPQTLLGLPPTFTLAHWSAYAILKTEAIWSSEASVNFQRSDVTSQERNVIVTAMETLYPAT